MSHEAEQDTRTRGRIAAIDTATTAAALYGEGNLVNLTDRPPHLHDQVHYRAYGTPGGEFAGCCRAAIVTGVGAWLDNAKQEPTNPHPVDGETRARWQTWHADAASVTVLNPSGEYRGVLRHDQSADPHGGTWHYPGEHCRPGGTR